MGILISEVSGWANLYCEIDMSKTACAEGTGEKAGNNSKAEQQGIHFILKQATDLPTWGLHVYIESRRWPWTSWQPIYTHQSYNSILLYWLISSKAFGERERESC